MQYALTLLAAAGLAMAAGPLEARTSCSISGVGSGTCQDTSKGCSGGSFHAGSGPPWPCPGGNNIQCCVKSASSAPKCSISGVGSGVCQKTSTACSGGSYHAGSGPPWPCPGGDDVQCCIKGSSGGGGGGGGGGSGGNLPGLNSVQSSHARAIMAEAKKENLGRQGCLAGLATGLTEASLLVYANSNVPASLKLPHDAVGKDHDSVGIFQQRVSIYKDIAADMDPAKSAAQFYKKMTAIKGWQTMDVGVLCQKVQVSAYPDRYDQHLGTAKSACSAGGF